MPSTFFTILNSMIMLCIIMTVGFVMQKTGIITEHSKKSLTDMLIKVILPCSVFLTFQVDYTDELFKNAIIAIVVAIFMHLLFIVIGYATCWIFKISPDEKGVVIFGMTFVNMVYMGFPILRSLFPPEVGRVDPLFYASLASVVFNVLTFTFGVKIIAKPGHKIKFTARDIFSNCNLAVIIGFTLFIFSIHLPKVISDSVAFIGQITSPLSLLLTGAIFATSNMSKLKSVKIFIVTIIRLIVSPIIFYFILKLFNIDPFLFKVMIILSTLPSASFTVIMAYKYEGNTDYASSLVFITSILSVFSVIILSLFLF